MKIVQSYWSKPSTQSGGFFVDGRLNGGWPHRVINYYSWALSCLQLCAFNRHVELVTDQMGKEMLIDRLGLPYTNVVVALNDIDDHHPGLWALGKIYTYGLQREPFLHVDGDIFVSRPFESEILNAPLAAQNLEARTHAWSGPFKDIWQRLSHVPAYFGELRLLKFTSCANAGILGGNDIAFMQNYVKEVFSFLKKNMISLRESLDHINVGHLNVIFEQVLFHSYANFCKTRITYLFPEAKMVPPDVAFFHAAAKNKGFVHCLGGYKSMRICYSTLEREIRTRYPEYYHRINDLVAAGEI